MIHTQKGTYGYINRRKKQLLIIAGLVLAVMLAVFITGFCLIGSRKNLLTVLAVVLALPFANFLATYLAIRKYRSPEKKEYEEFALRAGNLLTVGDLVITSKEMRIPVSYGLVCKQGVFLYVKEEHLNGKKVQEYLESMLRANQIFLPAFVFFEKKSFDRRVDQLSKAEEEQLSQKEEDSILRARACLMALSI